MERITEITPVEGGWQTRWVLVSIVPNPFDCSEGREIFFVEWNPRLTAGDFLAEYAPERFRREHLAVLRNGGPVDDAARIAPGDSLVITPHLGSGEALRTVAGIGIMAAAVMTGNWALTAIGKTFWGYSAALLAGGAVTIMGKVAINGLLPSAKPGDLSTPAISGLSQESGMGGSASYGWSGPQTSWSPGLAIPELFGEFLLAGQVINYYIDTNNATDEQTAKLLLCMCRGEAATPVASADDIYINGDIRLSTLDKYSFQTTKGTTGQAALDGFEKLHQYREMPTEMTTKTVLLLHADADTPFVDSSPSGKTVTTVGNTFADNTESKFGGKSAYFDGAGDQLTLADSADWYFAEKDFTVDLWVKPDQLNTWQWLVGQYVDAGNFWCLSLYTDNKIYFTYYKAGVRPLGSSPVSTTVLDTSKFYHVELCRRGNDYYLFVDGALEDQETDGTTDTDFQDLAATLQVSLAAAVAGINEFKGWMDEIRVLKGQAAHTAGFTVPTAAYDDDALDFYVTTKGEVDEAVLQMTFPNGLYEINAAAQLINNSCDFSIHYRAVGDATWILRQAQLGYTSGGGGGISEPDVGDTITGAASGASGTYAGRAASGGAWAAGTETGDLWVKDVSGTFQTAENLNNTTKAENNIATTAAAAGDIVHGERVTQNKRTPVRRQYPIVFPARDDYEIKPTRISAEDADTTHVSVLYLQALDEILDVELKYPYMSLLGVHVDASERLSGGINDVAAIWDRGSIDVSNWAGGTTSRASSNCAWAAMFLLCDREGVDPDDIDETTWTAWATNCDGGVDGNTRVTLNGVLDSQMSVQAALEKIEQIGRAKIIKTGSEYWVAVEKPDATLVQGFSVGNVSKGSFELEFLDRTDRPDVYMIEFRNKDKNFRRDSVPIYSAGYSSLTREPKIEEVFLWGCTEEDVARRYGLLRQQMSDKLNRLITFGADIDAVRMQVGDNLPFQHDGNVLTFGGRLEVQGFRSSYAVVLDQPILLDSGEFLTGSAYTGTVTDSDNIRIVTVDGAAAIYIDGVDFSDHVGKKITLTDSAGKQLTGYIRTTDTAEAKDSELLTSDNAWRTDVADTNATTGITGDDMTVTSQAGNWGGGLGAWHIKGTQTAGNGNMYLPITLVEGALYYFEGYRKNDAGSLSKIDVLEDGGGIYHRLAEYTGLHTAWNKETGYFTAEYASSQLKYKGSHTGPADVIYGDDFSLKRVTHLGATAGLIVSERTGDVRSWAGMDAGFDVNDDDIDYEIEADSNCKLWTHRAGDDDVVERTVTGPWDQAVDTIALSAELADIALHDVWMIARATGEAVTYRASLVSRAKDGKMRLAALEYNSNVFYHSDYDAGGTAI